MQTYSYAIDGDNVKSKINPKPDFKTLIFFYRTQWNREAEISEIVKKRITEYLMFNGRSL